MHKLLERQLRRHFGTLEAVPQDLQPFLDLVDEAYHAADQDRLLLERSMDLASQELVERNETLAAQVDREREAQEALRKSEEAFRRIVETASEGIWRLDEEDRISFVNQAMADMLGYPRDHIEGKRPYDFIPASHQEEARSHITERHQGQQDRFEFPFQRRDGSEVWFLVSSSPILDGATYRGTLTMFSDISVRKRAEEGLKAAYQHLQEVDEARSRFINAAAHELGTPLTPLKLQVQVLRKQLGDGTEAQQRSLDILHRNIERLARLAADLLDSSSLQAGQMALKATNVDFNQLVAASVETFEPRAKDLGIHLELRNDASFLPVCCDPGRIGQVLDNLLSNALKFTSKGGTIKVRTGIDEERAVVHVKDSGVGIAKADLKRLFQPFSQIHDTVSGPPGTGLGLYICKGIVEESDGKMWVASDGPGKGSTFTVSLPLGPVRRAGADE